MSPKMSAEKEQVSSSPVMPAPSSPQTGASDLWQSISTIIALQNQAPLLTPNSTSGKIPASFSQERLWLADQLQPGNSAYNIPFAFRIQGNLNLSVLEQSLKVLLQRHEALRTKFAEAAGKPFQVIQPVPEQVLFITDLSLQDPTADLPARIAAWISEEAQNPFDLAQGSLFRAQVLKLGSTDFVLTITVHHIVFDGWSEGILFKELSTLYNAYLAGETAQLPELSIQYADYSVWQRQWLQGDFLKALETYWQQQLSGNLQELRLPCDRQPSPLAKKTSQLYSFSFSSELTSTLKQFSRQSKGTLFPTLLAAFQALLWHYTQQNDLVICTPTANRNRSEFKNMIGYFVNLLVLRGDVSGDLSFQQLLEKTRQVNTGASAHQDLPTQKVAELLKTGQGALSKVLFALQNTPRQELQLRDLSVEALKTDNGTADFDLFLSLMDTTGSISGTLKYDSDLFAETTIANFVAHYQQVLQNIIHDPHQKISELLSFTEQEQQYLATQRKNAYAPKSSTTSSDTQYEAPRDSLELQLTQIWQEVLALPSVGIRDNFFELGGQSFLALRIFNQIEERFGKSLPLSTLLSAPTIADLATIIRKDNDSIQQSSLVPFQTQGSNPPFFCVHGLGGNVLSFRDLANHLGPDQPFYGLQPQGLSGDAPPLTRVEDMAKRYIKEIREVQPEGPYFIGGLSMGGLIAYEIAQRLRAQGQTVSLLALLDTYGPIYYRATSKRETLARHCRNFLKLDWPEKITFLQVILGLIGQKVGGLIHKLLRKPRHRLRGADAAILAAGGKLDRKPESYVATTPVTLANTQAARDYMPQKAYPDRVALIQVKQRPWWIRFDPTYGWEKLILKGLEIYNVPGNHYTFHTEPYAAATAQHIKTCISEACNSMAQFEEI